MRKLSVTVAALALAAAATGCAEETDLVVELQAIDAPGNQPFTTPAGEGTRDIEHGAPEGVQSGDTEGIYGSVPTGAPADESPAPDPEAPVEGAPEGDGYEEGAPEGEPYQEDTPEGETYQEDTPEGETYQEDVPEEEGYEEDAPEDGTTQEDAPEEAAPENTSSGQAGCDKGHLISELTGDEGRAAAFSEVLGIEPQQIEAMITGMPAVVLRSDTLVTNHAYTGEGAWEPFHALLEAGTAVLVDEYGKPAVRCQCGNPLTEPRYPSGDIVDPADLPDVNSSDGESTYEGEPWPGVNPASSTAIAGSEQEISQIVPTDVHTGELAEAHHIDVPERREDYDPTAYPSPTVSPSEQPSEEPTGYPEESEGVEEEYPREPGEEEYPEEPEYQEEQGEGEYVEEHNAPARREY